VAEPGTPAEPGVPVEPGPAAEPAEVPELVEPAEAPGLAEPVESVESAERVESVEPVESAEPGESGGQAEPDAPAGPATAARVEPVDIHPPTRLERTSYGAIRLLGLGLAKLWFRIEIIGGEKVPAHGPFVLSPVHRSNVDFLLASFVVPRRMRYMGKASIWKWSAPGRFFSMLGAFPVHRGSADRESLRTCIRVIENGEPLVMFPEGTRRSGPQVDVLFDGAAYVAARTGVPIVPVGVGGSEAAMPHGSKLIKPRKIVLVVGDPIEVPRGDGTGRVRRRVIRELTEQLYAAIQSCFDEARRRAG
jgi:1-acyl-sn-glycerol-3-phosphate acyltransferase